MDRSQLLALLDEVRAGAIAPDEAARRIAALPDAEAIGALTIEVVEATDRAIEAVRITRKKK